MNERFADLILAAVAVLLLSVPGLCPAGADEPGAGADPGLTPGDAVGLEFWREPELNGEYQIDERGIVVLPLLGERQVAGVPLSELRRRILEDYSSQLANQEVRVTPLRRIRVLGSVRNPGLYRVDATISVADALALAGGQTPDGRSDRVDILRDGRRLAVSMNGESSGFDMFLSGDQIFVPQRSWVSRNSTVIVGGLLSAAAIILAARL